MKLEVLASNLNQALGVVSRSVASRVQLPILSNILLKANKQGLELVSTDLEISFRVKIGARVTEEGQVTVPAKVFTELIATLGAATVVLETDEDSLSIASGQVQSKLQTMAAEDYPVVPALDRADLTLDVEKLVPSLNRVVVAASKDDSRPVFTGVLWRFGEESLVLAATDGYRLSYTTLGLPKVKLDNMADLIVPSRALSELARVVGKATGLVSVKFDQEQQQVVFKFEDVELVTRLLSGDFPAFEQIIPKETLVTVKLSRDELAEAVRRASIFARDGANIIRLRVLESEVRVSATSSQLGSNETVLDASVDGEGLEMAFNSRYLLDYLAIAPEEQLKFASAGALKPGVFKNDAFGFLHIIMPVRVQS